MSLKSSRVFKQAQAFRFSAAISDDSLTREIVGRFPYLHIVQDALGVRKFLTRNETVLLSELCFFQIRREDLYTHEFFYGNV